MKISELLKQLEAIRSQYGDLDVVVAIDSQGFYEFADLTRIEVEERTTVNLIADEEPRASAGGEIGQFGLNI
jgi:hypothetical protein